MVQSSFRLPLPLDIPSTSLINFLSKHLSKASWVLFHFYPSNSVLPYPCAPLFLYSPITHSPTLSLPLVPMIKTPLSVVCIPATCFTTGVFNTGHNCWENYNLGSVRLSLLASSSPRLSCSHVVRFLSPSVVFFFSACVCTECHEFDIVIA